MALFLTPTTRFCEGNPGNAIDFPGGRWELANSISALLGPAMFGLFGFLLPRRLPRDGIVQALYASIFVNGIGSFLYHGLGLKGFGLLDEMSQVMPLMLGLPTMFSEFYAQDSCHSCMKTTCCKYPQWRRVWAGITIIITILVGTVTLAVQGSADAANETYEIPTIFFIATTLTTLITMCVITGTQAKALRRSPACGTYKHPNGPTFCCVACYGPLRKMTWSTVFSMAIGAAFWLWDKFDCENAVWGHVGHSLFHMFLAYGVYTLVTFVSYVRANNAGQKPVYTARFLGLFAVVSWSDPSNYQPGDYERYEVVGDCCCGRCGNELESDSDDDGDLESLILSHDPADGGGGGGDSSDDVACDCLVAAFYNETRSNICPCAKSKRDE